MPVAPKPTRNQLRKAKKKAAKQNEAASTPGSEFPSGLETVRTDLEPAVPVDQEPEEDSRSVGNVEETTPARVNGNVYTMTSRLFVTATAYLLGLISLLVGVGILLNPTSFAKRIMHPYPPTTIARERASRAATPIAMIVGSQYTGIGLAILSLVYQRRLRALGTVLLCTVIASVITKYVEWNSSRSKTDALGVQSLGIAEIMLMALVGASGAWMVWSRMRAEENRRCQNNGME